MVQMLHIKKAVAFPPSPKNISAELALNHLSSLKLILKTNSSEQTESASLPRLEVHTDAWWLITGTLAAATASEMSRDLGQAS